MVEKVIDEEEEIIETSENETLSNEDKPDVSLQINDEDGVTIEVNDN